MLKLLKNLKQSWVSVIMIIFFLIVQAACDLTLPDYTSKIINVGIQNGGIEEVAPVAIRKTTIENLLIFTESDKTILDAYEEISKENLDAKEYEKLVKQYPALENEALYKIKKLSNEEKEELNTVMAKPLMIISYLENEEMSSQIKEQMLSNLPQNTPEQQKIAMANMNIMDIIKQMPEEQLSTMLSEINRQLDSMQDSILEQAAIQEVKQEC